MATIFEAVDTTLGNRVALKRLHPHIAARPGACERFLREGRAAARVRHPHVVQILALNADGGDPCLVMELLEGCDLGATIAREGPLAVDEALGLFLPVVAAVGAAHDAGVIHRDLKPSNVFVSRGPLGRPCPKVVDFGVSKVVAGETEAPLTATDGVAGTAAYMAPEHARAVRDASVLSDQYSLAVILYECVTGQLPFAGGSMYELLQAIMTAPLASPSQRVACISAAFDEVVLRAMSRDPRDRFASVRAFGVALLPFARERDRLAWHAELEGHLHAQAPHAPPPAQEGGAVTPTTMPPTAHDTHAAARKKRGHRARQGVIVTSAAGLMVAAGAWAMAHGLGSRRGDATLTRSASSTRELPGAKPASDVPPASSDREPGASSAIDVGDRTVPLARLSPPENPAVAATAPAGVDAGARISAPSAARLSPVRPDSPVSGPREAPPRTPGSLSSVSPIPVGNNGAPILPP